VVQTVAKVGITIQIDLKQGSDWSTRCLVANFDALFGGIGTTRNSPAASPQTASTAFEKTRCWAILTRTRTMSRRSIGSDHALGSGPEVKAAYDNLNRALVRHRRHPHHTSVSG